MAGNWVVGEVARLTAEIVDVMDAPIDPSALRIMVKSPAGTVTTYTWPGGPEITRQAAGVFFADIVLASHGVYAFRFETDAPSMGAAERTLTVRKSLFP